MPQPDFTDRSLICVGMIIGVHGVRGLVKLQSFTDSPAALLSYGGVRDEVGRLFAIEVLSSAKGQFLARIAGITDRTRAECLKGTRLYVERAAMPLTTDGEFYHADLIGLAAVDNTGKTLGRIAAVHNFGAGDVLDIRGEGRADFMVPFTRAFVPEIDVPRGKLVIADFAEVE